VFVAQQDADRNALERLFVKGKLSRRQFVAGLAALGVAGSGLEFLVGSGVGADAGSADAQGDSARYLVLVVLDAFRADYLNLQPMPTLAALARSGITYDRAWVGHMESETPTGHATLATGSMPRNDGIIGFEWRDPATGKERLDGWPPGVMAGQMERDLRASGAPSIPLAVKKANPKALAVALSSEKVYAADALGGWAADYILHHQSTAQNELVAAALPNHVPPAEFFQHPHLQLRMPLGHFTDWDYLSTMLALASVETFRPEVLMVNMPGGDVYGHSYGGPATPAVMRQVIGGLDRNLARIVNAYKKAGIFGQTLFVVTSDHGMVPNDRAIDGEVTKSVVRAAGGSYLFHTGGTAADIYLNNPSAAPAVAAAMARVPNVTGTYHLNPTTYQYEAVSGVPIDPALDAAYQYLLGTFAGPTAPAVVAAFRENTIGTALSSAHGDHGGLNWGAQHVPLVISGPGVPPGVVSLHPARLMDVAPTVLRLMGVPVPKMDGIVLADAVSGATAQEVAAQAQFGGVLTAYQNALIQQAADNIEHDAKTGHHPPPSAPMRP
jgi:hypothetical protein